jgi:serine/threonine protein kinase
VSRVAHLPLEERDRVADVVRAVVRVALLVGVPVPPRRENERAEDPDDSSSAGPFSGRVPRDAGEKFHEGNMTQDSARSAVTDTEASRTSETSFYTTCPGSQTGDVAKLVFLTLRDTLASLRVFVAAAADAARILDDAKHDRTFASCTRDEYGDLVAKSRNALEARAAVDLADAAVTATLASIDKNARPPSVSQEEGTRLGKADTDLLAVEPACPDATARPKDLSTEFSSTAVDLRDLYHVPEERDAARDSIHPLSPGVPSQQRHSGKPSPAPYQAANPSRRPRTSAAPLSPSVQSVSSASSRDVPSSESNAVASCGLFHELRENRIYDWMGDDEYPAVEDEIRMEPRSSSSSSQSRDTFRRRDNSPSRSTSRSTLSSEGFVRVDSGIINRVDDFDHLKQVEGNSNEHEDDMSPAPLSDPATPPIFPVLHSLHVLGSPSTSADLLSSIASVHPPPSYPPPPDHLSNPLSGRSPLPSSPPQPEQLAQVRTSAVVSAAFISGVTPPSSETTAYPMILSQRHFARSSQHGHLHVSTGVNSRLPVRRSGSLAVDRSNSAVPKPPLMPHGLSISSRVPSSKNVLASSPSIDRLAPDHFARTASVGFLSRNESVHSSQAPTPAPYNPAAALRVTFISVNSYGNTETSCDPDDVAYASVGGGLLGTSYGPGPSPSVAKRGSFRSGVNDPSNSCLAHVTCSVAETAGSLYRVGSIDERWFFGQMVGEGAFSEVRLGEGRRGGGRVAIKVISKGAPDLFGPGGVCREVLAFQTIGKHPNIVECIEVFEDDKFVYIVLELLTGGLLLARIADAEQYYPHYDERCAAHVIRSMVSALSYCHAIGVAHRDVKPENVLFVCEGMDESIKLTDFGIAHCSDAPCTDMSGTPLYVAPEVLLRRPYGCAADMWSVGVIAHILLVGHPPFDDDNILQLINKVKFKPVQLRGPEWKVVSEHARDFVARLLVKDPSARMTASEAQQHPWIALTASHEFTRGREWPSLEAAQRNIQEFVMHREFKRVIQHENAESALKLAMLVSMSEKSLADGDGGPEQFAKFSANNGAPHRSSQIQGLHIHGVPSFTTGDEEYSQYPVGYRSASRSSGPSGQNPSTVHRNSSTVPVVEDTAAASRALQEQAELRQRRLLYLEEKRVRSQHSEATDEEASGSSKQRRSKREPSSDFLEFDDFDTSESQTPTPRDGFDPFDTSPDLSAYAFNIQGTFVKERRNADADADWKRLRLRSERDEEKVEPASSQAKHHRKNLLWRRPPLFGGMAGGKTKLESKLT